MCSAFESLNIGSFWSTDADGVLTYISPGAREALAGDEPILGRPFCELFQPSDVSESHEFRGGNGQRTLPFTFAKRLRFERVIARSENRDRLWWWAISAEPQLDGQGRFNGFRGIIADVTEERQSAEENSLLAMNDPLTGLANRRHMGALLDRTVTAYAAQKRSCATMLIDLDRFKQVNDTLGHPIGDALLKVVAERLVKVIGDKEKVCRLGGDEFQVILPDVDDRGRLGDLATSIIAQVSEPYTIEGNRCLIGASVGIAVSPYDGETAQELVRNADLALYAAKHNGRGRHAFYTGELLESAEQRRQLEEDLHDALEKGQMELFFQPVVNAATNQVSGAEALIRWNHPEKGHVSPALFIPIAEESSLICKLGEWTLRTACMEAARWPAGMRVAVNVSPAQFVDEQLPRIVAHALASAGLEPERLELEITEGVFLQEGARTNQMFAALKGIGVRLALDDFGTGYSSLGYLKTAPFDKIKIDQSFVRGATGLEPRNKAIIRAIVTLAEALDMETTAEGVESFDQLDMVRETRVSHVQGYIFSRPVPARDFIGCTANGAWTITPNGPAKQRHERMTMYRNIGAVHEDHYYPAVLRNLSATGALIEGIMDVPLGEKFVLDFGEGQLVVAIVKRSRGHQQGVEFDTPLVDDGNGGLCTRQRILPHHLAAAGIPRNSKEFVTRQVAQLAAGKISMPKFSVMNKGGTITGTSSAAATAAVATDAA
ncbi:MAG: EAL domain-containing protein [Sphingomonadales bacterium]|nr:EAL domain-containing protein [Sphingomonadales bacterium]